MRKILMGLAAGALLFAVGCADPITSACKKAVECKVEGAGKTVEECVDTVEKQIAPYRESDKAECKAVVEAYENLMACTATMSCDEMKSGEGCEGEEREFEKAGTKAVSCYLESQNQDS